MTKAQRAAIIKFVAQSQTYDASTVIIRKDGSVTALADPDKTLRKDSTRYFVGLVPEILAEIRNAV